MADTYNWTTPGSGTFDAAAEWTDVTTPGSSGVTFPGAADTANLIGPASGPAQTITGPGNVSLLNVSGLNLLSGSFATGTTRVDNGAGAASLELAGSLSATLGLVVGDSGGGALSVDAGSTLSDSSCTGSCQVMLGSQGSSSGTLTVQGGGVLDLTGASQLVNYGVAVGQAGAGTLVVTGAGSTVDDVNQNGVVAGFSTNSAGSILVENGATANFGSTNNATLAAVAIGRAGNGTLAVDGTGSRLIADGGLYVGRGGAGVLVVSNSGVVTQSDATAYLQIGEGASSSNTHVGGSGSATVESGGQLISDASMRIGGQGVNGALTVSTGGIVSAVASTGTTGLGIGATTTVSSTVETGAGSLEIDAGGTVQIAGTASPGVAGVSIGSGAGSSGSVVVTGAGALLSAGSNLIVIGSAGTGTVVVAAGGSIEGSTPGTGFGAIVVGNSLGGVGSLTVSGAGSTATANGALTVGFQGQGSLVVEDGGVVTAQSGVIAEQAGSSGSVTISGATSTLSAGGTLSVDANGTLALFGGVASAGTFHLAAGGTIAGSGTIAGGIRDAGLVAASGGTLTLVQAVSGAGALAVGASSELVLAGGAAGGATVTFGGAAGQLVLLAPGTFDSTVSGFGFGDSIFAQGADSISLSGTTLSLFDAGSAQIGTIALSSVLSVGSIVDAGGLITYACFAAGTRLATADGAVAVEALAEGDRLVTASGAVAAVQWIGHRRVACDRHARPEDVWPVRIRPGAFGAGQPVRDLWLSPDHAVFVGGHLVPVRYLVNGRSIVQERRAEITYFHVELARHDIVLAEGLACESYLDTGNRAAFANGGPAMQLQPDFALRVWEAEACAPLALEGPVVQAARRRLLRRAATLGYRTTVDPGLRVLVDGVAVRPTQAGGVWRVRLPEGAREVRLLSRIWVPAQTRPAESDTRRLGVAIGRVWLDGRAVALDSPGFGAGWHAPEAAWRWTGGDAALSLAGVQELAFTVAMTGTYWRDGAEEAARAA